jgi:peptidoglycan/LPS O-acetylase OafA/YrhL
VGATQTSPAATIDLAQVGDPAEAAPSPGLSPPPGNPRFPLFDGLRGIAVLTILAFHASELTARVGFGPLGRAAEVLGSVSPILFFLISGFLLYRPSVAARSHGRGGPPIARYARRRALRIVPAYWTALTVLAILPGIAGVFSGDWWRYYGYLQIYARRTDGAGIPVAWTLCVEVSFYVALPLFSAGVALLARRARRRFSLTVELWPVALVALAGVGVQMLAARQLIPSLIATSIAGQCTWLCIGMALAVLSVAAGYDPRLRAAAGAVTRQAELCWLVAACAFAGLMALVPAGGLLGLLAEATLPQSVARTLARIILTGVFVAALALPAIFEASRPGVPRRLLGSRLLIQLGVISYSFYLYHFTVTQVIALRHAPGAFSATGFGLLPHLHFAPTLVLFLIALAVTTVVATISYRVIELPFLRRKG